MKKRKTGHVTYTTQIIIKYKHVDIFIHIKVKERIKHKGIKSFTYKFLYKS